MVQPFMQIMQAVSKMRRRGRNDFLSHNQKKGMMYHNMSTQTCVHTYNIPTTLQRIMTCAFALTWHYITCILHVCICILHVYYMYITCILYVYTVSTARNEKNRVRLWRGTPWVSPIAASGRCWSEEAPGETQAQVVGLWCWVNPHSIHLLSVL